MSWLKPGAPNEKPTAGTNRGGLNRVFSTTHPALGRNRTHVFYPGRAIDYENFVDRLPNELPAFSPGARR